MMECPYCGGEIDTEGLPLECQSCLTEFEEGEDGLEEIESEQ